MHKLKEKHTTESKVSTDGISLHLMHYDKAQAGDGCNTVLPIKVNKYKEGLNMVYGWILSGWRQVSFACLGQTINMWSFFFFLHSNKPQYYILPIQVTPKQQYMKIQNTLTASKGNFLFFPLNFDFLKPLVTTLKQNLYKLQSL